jgi:hypothetical protein
MISPGHWLIDGWDAIRITGGWRATNGNNIFVRRTIHEVSGAVTRYRETGNLPSQFPEEEK